MLKISKDLSATQTRNQEKIKELDEDRKRHWSAFCEEKTLETGNQLWSYLENVKSKIISKQYEDLIIGAQSEDVIIKVKEQDLR
jgi:hypothetical protein